MVLMVPMVLKKTIKTFKTIKMVAAGSTNSQRSTQQHDTRPRNGPMVLMVLKKDPKTIKPIAAGSTNGRNILCIFWSKLLHMSEILFNFGMVLCSMGLFLWQIKIY